MSMFREHYIGGLVAYTLFFVLSLGASLFRAGHDAMYRLSEIPPFLQIHGASARVLWLRCSRDFGPTWTSRAGVSRSFIEFSSYLAQY